MIKKSNASKIDHPKISVTIAKVTESFSRSISLALLFFTGRPEFLLIFHRNANLKCFFLLLCPRYYVTVTFLTKNVDIFSNGVTEYKSNAENKKRPKDNYILVLVLYYPFYILNYNCISVQSNFVFSFACPSPHLYISKMEVMGGGIRISCGYFKKFVYITYYIFILF